MSEQTERNEEQLEQIKDKTGKKYEHSSLHINRVPDHAVEDLKSLAADKFCNDYGMALTFLLELYNLKNEFDTQLKATTDKVIGLEEEMQALKQELQKPAQEKDNGDSTKVSTIG